MIDIAFITLVDPSGKSGQNTYSKEVATAIGSRPDVNLHLFCPNPKRGLPSALKNVTDTRQYIPEKDRGSIKWHLKSKPYLLKYLITRHREVNFDGIVAPLKTSTILPPTLSRVYDIPYVLFVEGMLTRNISKDPPFPGAAYLSEAISFWNAKNSTHTFTAYEESQEWMKSLWGVDDEKVEVFHHGVNPDTFIPIEIRSAREEIDEELSGNLTVGYVGSFKQYHRVDLLIDAIRQLRLMGIDCEGLLVGEGPKQEKLKRHVKVLGIDDAVHFTGYKNHSEIPNYICSCDIMYGFVDPDHWGSPMKVYEYMSCGRPPITYESNEFSIINGNNMGITLSYPSSSLLAEKMQRVVKTEEVDIKEMGKNAREYVQAERTWTKFANEIIDHINK